MDGDTPLHDAIAKQNNTAVNLIMSHPDVNLSIANKKDFTPLTWASFKGNTQ